MQFKIGDRVCFLNEKGSGIISGILSKTTVKVRIDEGFDLPFAISQLLPVSESNSMETDTNRAKAKDTPAPVKKSKPHHLHDIELEVDLHIEELLDSHSGMNNTQILDVQLKHVKRELEKAILSNAKKITFIHGMGVGRLKQELIAILNTYEGLRFHDAPYARYGFGATQVVLR
jgi:dsDNA-specific endonuclease/ATPase MutS2